MTSASNHQLEDALSFVEKKIVHDSKPSCSTSLARGTENSETNSNLSGLPSRFSVQSPYSTLSFPMGNHIAPRQGTPEGGENRNMIINKNSLVITNSRLTSEANPSQMLSTISFKDEICFALPPNATWEDVNPSSSNEQEMMYLFEITREMNLQLKRQKRRSRKSKERSSQGNDNLFSQYSPFKPKEFSTRKFDSNPSSSAVSNSRNEIRTKIVTVNPIKSAKPPSSSHTDVSSKEKIRINTTNLLSMRNNISADHVQIIESLRKLNLLDNNSLGTNFPTASHKNNRDAPREVNSKKKDITSEEELNADVKLQSLIHKSWQNIEEDEETNSKEILDSLQRRIQNIPGASIANNGNDCHSLPLLQQKENAIKNIFSNKVKKKKNKNKKSPKKSETGEETCNQNAVENQFQAKFDDYYDESVIEDGLQYNKFLKETIRINQKNHKEAYLFNQKEKDIFIDGVKDRNRALDGDEVVLELYPEDQWKVFPDNTVQKRGKVVRVTKQNHPRTVIGNLRLWFIKGKYSGILLWPRDNRLPKVEIPENTTPPNFRTNFRQYENRLFVAKILNWEYVVFASGILIEELGEQNDLEAETKCILLENNLNVKPIENADEYIPVDSNLISVEALEARTDLRQSCIFTIDPDGARDLDDALSCAVLPNGNFEIGVHIADVSHYLLPNTPLDKDACEKATSVYLAQTVYHMLPGKLCDLCSLTPNADKLAFSLLIEMNPEAEIVNHRFTKTVIRTCAQFTYKHAQIIIDEGKDGLMDNNFPTIMNGYTMEDCADVILNLYKLASKMRHRRFSEGALKIDQPKITFQLGENKMPSSYSLYIQKESNWLIEEFMLLANILTANYLKEKYPDLALLRMHAHPNEHSLAKVVETLEKTGIYIDPTTSGSIYQSMIQYDGNDDNAIARMAVIVNLLVKPMVKAAYVCSTPSDESVSDFWHYALNVPFYTHFTSPIRRYADVVVHRLLAASLGYCEPPQWTPEDIQEIADNCNVKKNTSKKASDTSSELFLKLYLEKNGPIKSKAVVFEVKERHLEIIEFSTRSAIRIFTEKIAAKSHYDNTNDVSSLTVIWTNEADNEMPLKQTIQIFTTIDVELSFKKGSTKIDAFILKPSSN